MPGSKITRLAPFLLYLVACTVGWVSLEAALVGPHFLGSIPKIAGPGANRIFVQGTLAYDDLRIADPGRSPSQRLDFRHPRPRLLSRRAHSLIRSGCCCRVAVDLAVLIPSRKFLQPNSRTNFPSME